VAPFAPRKCAFFRGVKNDYSTVIYRMILNQPPLAWVRQHNQIRRRLVNHIDKTIRIANLHYSARNAGRDHRPVYAKLPQTPINHRSGRPGVLLGASAESCRMEQPPAALFLPYCSPWRSSTRCPSAVVRYCCFGLRGLSGMVRSSRPSSSNGRKWFATKVSRCRSPRNS
jgi:hypothetical protein